MDERVTKAIAEMERRLAEPLTIGRLAAAVHLSRSRFHDIFRQATGLAPMRFLRELRLDRARILLENTTMSVTDVLALVGCTDASHFARDYCARHGVRPRDSRPRTPHRSSVAAEHRRKRSL